MSSRYTVNQPTDGAGGAANMPKRSGSAVGPAVSFLIVLIIAEYAVYLGLRYTFRSVHGG